MIVRYEPWGGWVKLESMAALVALDRDGVRALGLDGGTAWDLPAVASAPIEVHLAVTSRCGAGCQGCYIDARPDGFEPPREDLERALDAMRDAGVFTVAFGGGEPTTRGDLDMLADAAWKRGITPVVTTSGLGLSDARVERLRAFAQVNVSYDGAGRTYANVRGFDGAALAEQAIERLARAGLRVGVNVVLTRESFPALGETIARARGLGAREAQLLRYKPAGRAVSLDYFAHRLTPEQGRALGPTLRALAAANPRAVESPGEAANPRAVEGPGEAANPRAAQGPGEGANTGASSFRLRIDCALVPFLSADDLLGQDPARLTRFGVLGCWIESWPRFASPRLS